jgi:opacity protein-like surface antigen
MRRLGFAIATWITTLTGSYAATQGIYISGQGGVSYLPNLQIGSSTIRSTDSFKAGHILGTAIGYDAGDGWRYEVDLIHQSSAVDRFNGLPESGRLWSMGLMANIIYDLTQGTTVTPYLGAGVGVQWIGGAVHGYSGKAWRPAYQLRTGVRYDLARRSALFVEYRFSQSQAVTLASASTTAKHDFAEHALRWWALPLGPALGRLSPMDSWRTILDSMGTIAATRFDDVGCICVVTGTIGLAIPF